VSTPNFKDGKTTTKPALLFLLRRYKKKRRVITLHSLIPRRLLLLPRAAGPAPILCPPASTTPHAPDHFTTTPSPPAVHRHRIGLERVMPLSLAQPLLLLGFRSSSSAPPHLAPPRRLRAVVSEQQPVAEEGADGRPLRVGIVCGGPSAERGVSLNSARSVLDHIQVRLITVTGTPTASLTTASVFGSSQRLVAPLACFLNLHRPC
jgi:hypothetical protein